MTTVIRPEVSKKNQYYIPKHRYYELKHFCLQYSDWKKEYACLLRSCPSHIIVIEDKPKTDPTEITVERRLYFRDRIEMLEKTALAADPIIGNYILKAVTQDLSYVNLRTFWNIPCSKGYYYERYRKFFWLLSNSRK